MANKVTVVMLTLLLVVYGGLGYYTYALSHRVNFLSLRLVDLQQEQGAQIKAVNEELTALRGETRVTLGNLQREIASTRHEIGELGNEIDQTKHQIGTLQREMDETRSTIDVMRHEMDEMRDEMREAKVPLKPRRLVEVGAGNYPSYLYASATQAKNGDILVFTRVGTTHSADKGKTVLFRSSDNGLTWGDAEIVAEDPTYDLRNPISVTLPDGRILLGLAVYAYKGGLTTQPNRILYSDDNGRTWRDLASVTYPPYFASPGNMVLVPSTGDLLLPAEDTTVTPWRAVILASTDKGVTWTERASLSVSGHQFNEPTLAYTDRGKLVSVIRDDTSWYYWSAESLNNGYTWSKPVPYPQLTGSQPSLARVGNYLVLVSRDELMLGTQSASSPGLTLYSSKDGIIWRGKEYLALVSPMGGSFHASYGTVMAPLRDTFLVFFSVEKQGWFDSGVYYVELDFKDASFQDKSLPATILEIETLGAGESSRLEASRELALEGTGVFALTVESTYDSLATAGMRVHIYSSYDGVHYDTESLKDRQGATIFGNVPFTPGETVRKTKDITSGARYIKVIVENMDRNKPLTKVKVVAVVK